MHDGIIGTKHRGTVDCACLDAPGRTSAATRSDAELLAVVLACSVRGRPALTAAEEMLRRAGGLGRLAGDSGRAASATRGVGPAGAARLVAAIELGRRCIGGSMPQRAPLSSPRDAADFLHARLAGLDHEVFACLFLDTRHRVICFEPLFRGTIDGAPVYPREVLKRALHHNAAALILAHNHPSGDSEPSDADRRITQRLQQALGLVDIGLLDHLVVSASGHVSLAERGWL